MPFHILSNQLGDRRPDRRASESAALNGNRAGIKEILQNSLSAAPSNQLPPPITISDVQGRSRSSSLTMLKMKLGTSHSRTSSFDLHTRGRSASNDLNPTTSNISMSANDVTSTVSSNYEQFPQRFELSNKYLIKYLKSQGLSDPTRLSYEKHQRKLFGSKKHHLEPEMLVSNTGKMLLLPYLSSKRFTRNLQEDENDNEEGDEGNDEDELDSEFDLSEEQLNHTQASNTPLNRINHTFAVILKLDRKQTLNPVVKLKFSSDCSIDWVNGIHDSQVKKTIYNESYKVTKDLVWDLSLDHTDCYIPLSEENLPDDDKLDTNGEDFAFMDDSESSNTNTTSESKPDKMIVSTTPSQQLRILESFNYKERSLMDLSLLDLDHQYHYLSYQAGSKQFEPGFYVFLLPILFPHTMPETINSPLGKVTFNLNVKFQPFIGSDLKPPQLALFSTSPILANKSLNNNTLQSITSPTRSPSFSPSMSPSGYSTKTSNKLFKSLKHTDKNKEENVRELKFELPVIRQPPPDSVTTINKSIYVNKIWNDSLNYEITFPKKYVSMSSFDEDIVNTFDLRIKIMPLVKNIYMKRIRVNMVEKITYASKSLRYEYDYGKEYHLDKGIKERIIPLFEIKTKEKPNAKAHALRSEIVKNCVDDNLLTTCYNGYTARKNRVDDRNADDVVVTNTVKISCPLSFYIKNDDLIKNIKSSLNNNNNSAIADDSDTESVLSQDPINRPGSPLSSLINMISKSPLSGTGPGSIKKDDSHQLLKDKFGLYPDVAGFGNINIKHRLQICFRISKQENADSLKPGEDPNKLHHYEVIIDTPIVLNSPFASDQTPPSYSDVLLSSVSDFQIRPIYEEDNLDIDSDLYHEPPPPPFEFHPGSPINGMDVPGAHVNINDVANSPSFSFTPLDDMLEVPLSSRSMSVTPSSRQPSISSSANAPTGGFSTIDELLVAGSGTPQLPLNQSNLSKLLSQQLDPPEYSKIDQAVKSDEEELDIGGENFVSDEGELHESYNKRRIEEAKRKHNILMKKIEDDIADFTF